MEDSKPIFTVSKETNKISVPTIDIAKFLDKTEGWEAECEIVTECLKETGILVIKDPVAV